MSTKASILVVSGNLSSRNARNCLKSLKANTPPGLVREEIIIEAGIRPDFNHAEEINKAMHVFSGGHLVLLDDDVILKPGWLEGLIKCAEQCEGAGVIGAVLRNRRGDIISSGGDVTDSYFGVDQKESVSKPVERKYVTSAVMLITRTAAETIGPFDVRFRKYGQDADYCFRAWEAGFKVLVTPDSQAIHLVGETVNLRPDMKDLFEKDKEIFYSKWRQSPIYNRFEVIDLTRRGVLYLTSENVSQRSLEEMMREMDGLRNRDRLDYVDIAGGSPEGESAEYKHLRELVVYCRSIGLLPTIITNGQYPDVYADLIDAALEDLLICVHGHREDHDRAPRRKGAVDRINKTVDILKGNKFGFRTSSAFPDLDCRGLPELAGKIAAMGPRMANLIFSGPHESFRSKYADAAPCLKEAIDRLTAAGVWTNTKHFPLCLLKGYEQHVCNFHQRPWDPYEWDNFPGYKPDRKEAKKIRRSAERENLYGIFPDERMKLWITKHRVCGRNIFFEQCGRCANRAICDGVHPEYAAKFGNGEFVPLEGEMMRDPLYYRKKNQSWRMMKQRPVR